MSEPAAGTVETGNAVAGAPAHPLTGASGEMPLIRLQGITKTYGEGTTAFQALKGVDLDIHAGDFVAIMGPSGSGKSTAMNTLGCLDRPTTGAYLFQGVRVESLSRDQRARLRRRYFGFVFQGFNLLARTSAQENVELPLIYRGEPGMRRLPVAAVGVELRHQREHQRERHGGVDGNDERRLPAGADSLHPLLQLARGPQQDATSRQQLATGGRQPGPVAAPVEQQHVEILLQPAHRVGDCRGHARELLRGGGETPAAVDGIEYDQGFERQRHVQII